MVIGNKWGRIVGRNKDCIIRGGENVYPREIEEFLYSHPKIADVQIVGVPDKKVGILDIKGYIKVRRSGLCLCYIKERTTSDFR